MIKTLFILDNLLLRYLFLPLILVASLAACRQETRIPSAKKDCNTCHEMQLDTAHSSLDCKACHHGTEAGDKELAHKGLVLFPASPENMVNNCAPCHQANTSRVSQSLHFTLRNLTNKVRHAFGANQELASFLETPQKTTPKTLTDLADDLLRRRCFRCHPYGSGDDYPATTRGQGCAACHIHLSEKDPKNHRFSAPTDRQCLGCHYGNYVGSDYYGYFEHDFNAEYRTPYTGTPPQFTPPRRFGVESHQLRPDVHQLRGLWCMDCHSGDHLMGAPQAQMPSCKACHSPLVPTERGLPAGVKNDGNAYIFIGHDGKKHPLPLMQHPAHERWIDKVSCQGCHAQWSFNDSGRHFLRSDSDDYGTWENLQVQGSSTVEKIIRNNSDFDNDEIAPAMADGVTGLESPGLWHKGYSARRWEEVVLGRDDQGRISPVRPLLDLYLSWVDEDETVRFDSVSATSPLGRWTAYVPHTTGPAGIFYIQGIQGYLQKEYGATSK